MDICKLRHLRYYSLAQCVSFYYIKKFSVKNWSRWNGTDYPLIQQTKLLKNVTQIIPMLPWVKLDKNDCINCVLSLINWDDTSGFMVSLFENWIDLYVGTSHFISKQRWLQYKQILNEIHLTLSHVFIYTQRGWWTKHFTYWHLKLSPQTSLRYLYTRRVKRKNSIILL